MKEIINSIKRLLHPLKIQLANIKWRKNNKNNFTVVVEDFPQDNVFVGKATYGNLNVVTFHKTPYKLVIGSYCSIANNVTFFLDGEHKKIAFLHIHLILFLI